ncbi:hypothetical protein [Parapedobacter sp. 10938]|uniref:hypothetical protein n=1 Tax=Parapedobacter flavus TaxID=3110225 RepID=UPI002DBC4949|nr:hypothetical protein [Parapedobacter sp. 10938]MEC3880244.1 hypothetical protein [Parapedobacter sp. 10938]
MTKTIKYVVTILMLTFIPPTTICNAQTQSKANMKKQKEALQRNDSIAKDRNEQLACKLTSPELRERKETVIASLKKQLLDRKELSDGYAFKFP